MNWQIFFGIILIGFGALVVYQNPDPYQISLLSYEIRASSGVMWVSSLGLGILTGVVAMLTRDVPRMRRLRGVEFEE